MGITTFSGPIKSGPVINGSTQGGYRGRDLKDTNWVKNSFVHYFQEPAAQDADGICTSQTTAAAANLTLDGALTQTVNGNSIYAPALGSAVSTTADAAWARRIAITSDGNDSGITFTVYGTDVNGKALSETVTGPNSTVIYTTSSISAVFKSVNRIATSAATTGNITVGTQTTSASVYARQIGILPFQSSVTDIKIHVTEAFDSATTDVLEIGKSDDQDYLADVASARMQAAAAVAQGNQVDVDATQAAVWMSVSQSETSSDGVAYNSDVQVTALLTPTGAIATAGKAWIEVEFLQAKNLASGDTW